MLTQTPVVLASFGVLMVVFALSMFGVFRLQLPNRWQTKFAEWSGRLPGGRIFPVFLMGALSALIVGPCSTPALAGALTYIANTRDVVSGALDLYAMGLGMGLPLLLVGTFGAGILPKAGRWMTTVQNTLGVMLLVAALLFVYSLLPNWLSMLLVAALLASCGMMCRAIDPLAPNAAGIYRVGKALGFDEDTVGRLAGLVHTWEWKDPKDSTERQFRDAGLDLNNPRIKKFSSISVRGALRIQLISQNPWRLRPR